MLSLSLYFLFSLSFSFPSFAVNDTLPPFVSTCHSGPSVFLFFFFFPGILGEPGKGGLLGRE